MSAPALRIWSPEQPPLPADGSLKTAVERYLDDIGATDGTRRHYATTLNKWHQWLNLQRCVTPLQVTAISYEDLKDFLDWVYELAIAEGSTNPGRVHNQRRENLSAVLRWLADPETGDGVEISAVPTLPRRREQRTQAGLAYLEESEINAIYWRTFNMRVRGWEQALPVGAYWRSALVFFYNYGVDTGTVFPYEPRHEPLLWGDIYESAVCPDRSIKLPSGLEAEYGWIYYVRTKTGAKFVRPLNRVVRAHLDAIRPAGDSESYAGQSVFTGGGCRPNERFKSLWQAARVQPKLDAVTNTTRDWCFKDLRKTSSTWHDLNLPGAGSPVLGHQIEGSARVTAAHYSAAAALLAAKSILTLPQPRAFRSIYDQTIAPPAMLFVK